MTGVQEGKFFSGQEAEKIVKFEFKTLKILLKVTQNAVKI